MKRVILICMVLSAVFSFTNAFAAFHSSIKFMPNGISSTTIKVEFANQISTKIFKVDDGIVIFVDKPLRSTGFCLTGGACIQTFHEGFGTVIHVTSNNVSWVVKNNAIYILVLNSTSL